MSNELYEKTFETREGAEKALSKAKEMGVTKPGWFCPEINDNCNPECWCYVRSIVVLVSTQNDPRPIHKIQRHYCDNAMFSHRRTVQNQY